MVKNWLTMPAQWLLNTENRSGYSIKVNEVPDVLVGSARPSDKVGRVLYKLSAGLALFGSFVIAAMAVIVFINVTGRATSLGSLSGIIDLIELLTNTAVFAFLPYCQIMRDNVIVDFILTKTPTRTKTIWDAFGSLIFIIF